MCRVGALVASYLLVVTQSCDGGGLPGWSIFNEGLSGVGISDAGKNLGSGLNIVSKPISTGVEQLGSATAGASQSFVNGPVGSLTRGSTNPVVQEVKKDLQTIGQPIGTTVSFIGSSQCKRVQRLFGVSYYQVEGDNEPNLDSLELVYKTRDFTTTMKITQSPASLLQARRYDQDARLVVYLHGFTDDPSQISFETVSEAYLEKGRLSVVALDASSLIRWLYIRAATYVRFIGERLGEVLAAIFEQGQDPALIHIVGHSLGSHIAGFACQEFERRTGRRVGRVSALDPAGPCFSHISPQLRLKRTDADYVDVIHTDAGIFGLKDPCGHKDYYPNSGAEQPDCVLPTCSHSRAWELFAESVLSPQAFPAARCADWEAFEKGDCDYNDISYMGYASSAGGTEGLYFLQTGAKYPFGRGANGTRYRNDYGVVKNVAKAINLAR